MMSPVTDDEIIDGVRERIRAGRPLDHSDAISGLPAAPATAEAVDGFERLVGHPFPSILRRLYLEVANGGVGPGYGTLRLPCGWTGSGRVLDLATLYRLDKEDGREPEDPPPLAPGIVMLCDWGCANWSMVDCREPGGLMWWWAEGERYPLDYTPAQWLERWLEGSLLSPNQRADGRRGTGHPDEWDYPDECALPVASPEIDAE